jgi:hypothetical protein
MHLDNITARYSWKKFSRLFLAIASSSHRGQGFTRNSILKATASANFTFTGSFRELNCCTSYINMKCAHFILSYCSRIDD